MTWLTTPAAETINWRATASTPIANVVLNDVKTWINRPIEDTFWDAETTDLIRVAQRMIEAHCQLSLSLMTWVGTMSQFSDRLRIVKRPFLSLEKIEYVDDATGEIRTLDPSLYQVAPFGQMCGLVTLGDGVQWPSAARRLDAIRLTVTTGFVGIDGATPEIPIELLHALKMTVAELDGSRGDDGGGGGRQTVYAMKQNRSGFLSPSIREELSAFNYVSFHAI